MEAGIPENPQLDVRDEKRDIQTSQNYCQAYSMMV